MEQARLTIDQHDRPDGDGWLIEVVGELEMSTAPRLRQTLTGLPADRRVVLDLSALSFCDSSGLNALLVAHRHFAGSDGSLVLKNPPARVRAMLELTGLAQVFAVSGP